ncbi:MAG: hypothetical protein CM15mP6_3310 [Methanobacteriota archaeon]|nr:MAG: hypothetical protein CM15mP6_3310 [Euryarchaeota archaeon]
MDGSELPESGKTGSVLQIVINGFAEGVRAGLDGKRRACPESLQVSGPFSSTGVLGPRLRAAEAKGFFSQPGHGTGYTLLVGSFPDCCFVGMRQ